MSFLAKLVRFFIVLILLVAGGYVGIHNQASAVVHIPPWIHNRAMPLYVALMGAFLLGGFAASLYFGAEQVRKTIAIRRLNRVNQRLRAKASAANPALDASEGPAVTPEAP